MTLIPQELESKERVPCKPSTWEGASGGDSLSPRSHDRGTTGLRFWPSYLIVTSANSLPLMSPLSLAIPGFLSCHRNLSRQNSKSE